MPRTRTASDLQQRDGGTPKRRLKRRHGLAQLVGVHEGEGVVVGGSRVRRVQRQRGLVLSGGACSQSRHTAS